MNFFSDFELSSINTKRGVIRYRKAGQGPVLLMLHGNPQTHAMWHKVAPELVNQYTVICPDIPGYGKSFKPVISNNHSTYSKINMALDIINFMELLGFDKFQIVAHDRGARIAHHIALDFPEKVIKMILLDTIPTIEHFERTNMEFAMGGLAARLVGETIANIVGYQDKVKWDKSKPDGVARKILSSNRAISLGWKTQTTLLEGLKKTYNWFLENKL